MSTSIRRLRERGVQPIEEKEFRIVSAFPTGRGTRFLEDTNAMRLPSSEIVASRLSSATCGKIGKPPGMAEDHQAWGAKVAGVFVILVNTPPDNGIGIRDICSGGKIHVGNRRYLVNPDFLISISRQSAPSIYTVKVSRVWRV